MKALLDSVRVALAFVGFFVACAMVLVLCVTVFVWLGDPRTSFLPRGAAAAREVVTSAWELWLLGAGMLICDLLVKRFSRRSEAGESIQERRA